MEDIAVFPYRHKDSSAAEYAKAVNASLAGKRGTAISLSTIDTGSRIVLPSPNGATCSFLAKDSDSIVIAGCIRNAASVASYIKKQGGIVTVIAAGERWPDGSLRPAFEDMVAAGAILSYLADYQLSPEAQSAVAVFHAVKHDLPRLLLKSSSGQELLSKGFPEDVTIASHLNASSIVPVLNQAGAFERASIDSSLG